MNSLLGDRICRRWVSMNELPAERTGFVVGGSRNRVLKVVRTLLFCLLHEDDLAKIVTALRD